MKFLRSKFKLSKFGIIGFIVIGFISPIMAQEISLLPKEITSAIINEISGEKALQTEIMLAPFERIRESEEFTNRFWETTYIMKKAQEYGLEEVQLHTFPSRRPLWQPIEGELWLIEPEKKKIADIHEIAAVLATESQSAEVSAEVIYMEHASDENDYKGKDVKGKIILTADPVYSVQEIGVLEKGALGVISSMNNSYELTSDVVHWQGSNIAQKGEPPLFGFSVSNRQIREMKGLLENHVQVKAQVKIKAKFHEGREEVVSATIPGTDLKDETFVLVAHLFEGISKQGANDNNSGSACILEVGRCLVQLIKKGIIPPPRRNILFLWVPEISGSIKYLEKHPEVARSLMGGINMDVVGENLFKTNAPFHIYRTPHSLPGYINDIAENIFNFTVNTNRTVIGYGQSQTIISPSGSRQNFLCWMDDFDSGSDNDVFVNRQVGVPMIYFNVHLDNWIHTNRDSPELSDPTQLKRAGFMGVTITAIITGAKEEEALKICAESFFRGCSRLALCQQKAHNFLALSTTDQIHQTYKKAYNLVTQRVNLEIRGLSSCLTLEPAKKSVINYVSDGKKTLLHKKQLAIKTLEKYYHTLCKLKGVSPLPIQQTPKEKELSALIPKVTTKEVSPRLGQANRGLAISDIYHGSFEVFNFIDGKRSILDIGRAVDAEFFNQGGVPLQYVEELIRALEKAGLVKIHKN
jgi:hypothetical protein